MFAHLVNPVVVGPESDLFVAQPITFETMRRARAAALASGIEVSLFACRFEEDYFELPGFVDTPPLHRSVLDFGAFPVERRLPLLGDLIDRLAKASAAEYGIYTNVDIALQPDFYIAAAELVRGRLDAAVINRRTVAASREQAGDLDWLHRQAGEPHPGWDCFVFRRGLLDGFDFGSLCIGAVPVGQALLAVLSTLAERFELVEDRALTFHLNDERAWSDPALDAFQRHNFREAGKIVEALEAGARPLSPFALRLARRLAAAPSL